MKQVQDVEFSLHWADNPVPGPAKPASVGAIVQMRPHMTVAAGIPTAQFDRLWTRADLIKHAHFIFTKPHYGSALVTSVMFSSEPIE